MRNTISVCIWAVVCAAPAAPASAADYYLSAGGDDRNPGTLTAPWRTLDRVNAITVAAGDRVLLRAGDTFDGQLTLDASDGGTAASPVTITTYGAGRATIRATGAAGVSAENVAGIRIANLTVVGDGAPSSGIVFYTDLPGGAKLPFIRVENVEVSGFGRDGIEVGSWNGTSGFRDVRITRAWTHHNARTGILTYSEQPLAHEDVYVGYSTAFANPGIPLFPTNSGSGIVLGGVNGGTIEWSTAHANGALNAAVGGPVGIWTYDSSRITLQYNESYANRTGSTADGGGFDLDRNVSDSVMQYNYSHDNDGAGYLLAHEPDTAGHRGNIVRYNLSENDGRRNAYGGIELWGRISGARIHHNTVRIGPAATGSPAAVRVWNAGAEDRLVDDVSIHDNVFVSTGGMSLVDVTPAQAGVPTLRFEGNVYHASGGVFAVRWAGSVYRSLADWRTTGQEMNEGTPSGAEGVPPAAAPAPDIVLDPGARATLHGAWRAVADSTTASGVRVWHPNGAASKLVAPLSAPNHYFEIRFTAVARQPYRVWMRLKAESDHWANDSVFAQFSGAVDAAGVPRWRIGSTSALELNLEECGGCGVAGWGWQDTGYGSGVMGPLVYFAADGEQVLRVQTREDGISVDQIVLSSGMFVDRAPGQAQFDATVLPEQPSRTVLPPATPAPAADVIIHAADVPAPSIVGAWHRVADATAAGGVALWNPDRGAAKVSPALAQPASYFDVTFPARAAVDYHLWVRLRADGDSHTNDSISVQFSGAVDAAGAPLAPIGSRSAEVIVLQDTSGAPLAGWGWNDTGWAGMAAPVRFARSGDQTLRIQQREDGIRIDQIVLSPARYLGLSPGLLLADRTIVLR